jgi:hypothetical protein
VTASKRPIRKVGAATAGGLPAAAAAAALIGWLWPGLPESVVGLVGAAVIAGIAYLTPSAPGEAGGKPHPLRKPGGPRGSHGSAGRVT